MMRRIALLLAAPAFAVAQTPLASPHFEITFDKSAHSEPITGRVYVAIRKTSDANRTPIQQAGETGVPFFGVNIDQLAAGAATMIDGKTFRTPVRSARETREGEYWVQPFVNIYTTFARADGHTVWLHMDQWEGQ